MSTSSHLCALGALHNKRAKQEQRKGAHKLSVCSLCSWVQRQVEKCRLGTRRNCLQSYQQFASTWLCSHEADVFLVVL